jgi:hypothetical protein
MADPEELSEDSLFDQAVGDAPAEAAAEPAGEAEPAGQPRDDAGRFAEKPEDKPETVEATEATAKPAVDDNAAMVPSWRVREINEERRAQAAELEALRTERAQWQQRQQQPKPEPAAEKAKPDPLLDPEGYDKYIEAKVEARILNDRRDLDLELTRQANTEAFDKAHNEAMRLKAAGDPAFVELSQKMNATSRPGKVLLDWHNDRSVKAEVGSDPNAWLEKKLEERMNDPAFLARAVERARAGAAPQQQNGRPRVELPPSLNGASRSNAALRSAMNADVDDEALFDQTTA